MWAPSPTRVTKFTLGDTDYGEDGVASGGAGAGPVVGDPGLSVTDDVVDSPLSVLDQGIVLALCLDIKNHNPLVRWV